MYLECLTRISEPERGNLESFQSRLRMQDYVD